MRGKVQSIMITALFVCISLLIPSYIYANTEKLAIQVEAQNARVNFQVNDTTLVGQEVSVVCYRPSWDGNYGNWANNTAQIAYLTQIQFENAKPYSFGIGQVEKGDYTLVIGTAGGKLVKKFSFDASVTPIGPAVTQPSQVVASPGSVKVRQSAANAVKLTWSEVLGAKKYEIYRATKKNGTYKRIATVSSKTSYTNKKLTPGKTYYYKVCAMDGELCVAKKITLMTVLKPKITVKQTGIIINWKKDGSAAGYKVYFSSKKNGKYKIKTTVKSNKKSKTTVKGLKKGSTYYFKVRPYCMNGKKTILGKYSKSIKVTMK